jgi:TonB family protein
MRKTTVVSALYFCISLSYFAVLGMICLPAFSQDATPAFAHAQEAPAVAMPSEPKELLLLAAKTNGLTGDDVKPWHGKVTYKSFDEQGNVKYQGTIEEFWVSPTKHKLTFTSGSLSQTMYGSERGDYMVGGAGMDLLMAYHARREFFDPLPSPQEVMWGNYVFQERQTGSIMVVCLHQQDTTGRPFGLTWCMDSEKPDLRISVNSNGPDVLHRNIVRFQGRSIAGDLKFSGGELENIESNKPVFEAHLETIEPLTNIDDTDFVPPQGATPPLMITGASFDRNGVLLTTFSSVPKPSYEFDDRVSPPDATPKVHKISVSGGVMVAMLLKKVDPVYPGDLRLEGTVVLQALINKEGHIENLHVISGHPMLRQAALDAVKQWVYKPYLLNGEPIEVETTINVVFKLEK